MSTTERLERSGSKNLFEDIVKKGVVAVVVHASEY